MPDRRLMPLLLACLCVWLSIPAVSPAGAAEKAALRDPTLPPVSRASLAGGAGFDPASWKLSATLIGPKRSVAVINGRIAEQGDVIDRAEVVAIQAGRVRLRIGSSDWVIRENDGAVRKTPAKEVSPPKKGNRQ
ncbi:MAG: hypothetical protein JXB25_03010 [Deltaproteobacteria bacterium]|nr:hypothetical protein [Deltaproteobacteria bacterium]